MALKLKIYFTASLSVLLWACFAANAGFSLAFEDSSKAFWRGTLQDRAGNPLPGILIELRLSNSEKNFISTTDQSGVFTFTDVPPGVYVVTVHWQGLRLTSQEPVEIQENARLEFWLELATDQQQVLLHRAALEKEPQSSGGERLSSQEIANLPLNKRDYSKLLTLEAGTTTDTNSGAGNFTQQFAANGQRGSAAVFAVD